MRRKILSTALILTGITASAANIGNEQEADKMVLKSYLNCINQQAKALAVNNGNNITDAQTVIDNCQQEKQTLLNTLPDDATRQIIARIEKHLKKREKKSE